MTRKVLVGCIICDEENGVLMVHRRTSAHAQWEIPGGWTEESEEPRAAAVREVKNQIGVDIAIIRELGERHETDGDRSYDYQWFFAKVDRGEPRIQKPDIYNKWGYFTLLSLTQRYDELSPHTKSFLEAIAYGEIDLDI